MPFIELTRTNGTQITLNVAEITAIGFDKVTMVGGPKEPQEKTFVTTSAPQLFHVQESYAEVRRLLLLGPARCGYEYEQDRFCDRRLTMDGACTIHGRV